MVRTGPFGVGIQSVAERRWSSLSLCSLPAGSVLLREGEPSNWYARVVSGSLEVTRRSPVGPQRLAVVEAGALVGELGLLTGVERRATVTALTDSVVDFGDAELFARCLQDEGFVESFAGTVADRLASLATPVTITLAKGGTVTLRPGLAAAACRAALRKTPARR